MNTIRITAATVAIAAAAALGLTAPASANPVPGGNGGALTPSAQPGPASFDYDAYIAFRKVHLSLQRAARP